MDNYLKNLVASKINLNSPPEERVNQENSFGNFLKTIVKTGSLSIGLGIIASMATPALAANSGKYTFNKYVGDVYVSEVELEEDGYGTLVRINMSAPTCTGTNTYLAGQVKVDYKGPNNGGHFTGYGVLPEQGSKGWFTFHVPYRVNPSNGTVNVTDALSCEFDAGGYVGDRIPEPKVDLDLPTFDDVFGW